MSTVLLTPNRRVRSERVSLGGEGGSITPPAPPVVGNGRITPLGGMSADLVTTMAMPTTTAGGWRDSEDLVVFIKSSSNGVSNETTTITGSNPRNATHLVQSAAYTVGWFRWETGDTGISTSSSQYMTGYVFRGAKTVGSPFDADGAGLSFSFDDDYQFSVILANRNTSATGVTMTASTLGYTLGVSLATTNGPDHSSSIHFKEAPAPSGSYTAADVTWNSAPTNIYHLVVQPELQLSFDDELSKFGPIGWWKLNDASSPFVDYGSGANDGVGTAVTAQGIAGPDGRDYATFDPASGSKITIPDLAGYSVGTAGTLTIVALVFADSLAAADVILQKGITGTYTLCEWSLDVGATDAMQFATLRSNGTNVRTERTGNNTLTTGRWYLLHAIVQGTLPASDQFLYIDGVSQATTTTVGANSTANLAGDLVIGNRNDLTGYGWDGGMAHVAIFPGTYGGTIQRLADAARAEGWIP